MDLIDRKALVAEWKSKLKRLIPDSDGMHSISLEKVIEALEKAPTVEAYSAEAVKQIMWERDMAIQQLNDYGVQLGEKADCAKVVRCKDCNYYSHGVCWNGNITGNCDCDLEKEPNGFCDWGERRGD